MTFGDLKELVESMEYEGAAEDTPIKLAMQPNYPMVGSINNFCLEKANDGNIRKIWIACSGHEGYGCPQVWGESEIYPDEEE